MAAAGAPALRASGPAAAAKNMLIIGKTKLNARKDESYDTLFLHE